MIVEATRTQMSDIQQERAASVLVSALAAARRSEKVADTPTIEPATGDDAVVDDDPTVSASRRYASEPPATDQGR